jgi:hypothetical protein
MTLTLHTHYQHEQEATTLPLSPLFWEVIPPPTYPRKHAPNPVTATTDLPKTRQTRCTRKTIPNPYKVMHKDCWSVADFDENDSSLMAITMDNILAGIVLLDLGGNTRPVSQRLLSDLLRNLDEISAESVQRYTEFSLSYSRKVAGLVRIAITALNRIVDDGLHR